MVDNGHYKTPSKKERCCMPMNPLIQEKNQSSFFHLSICLSVIFFTATSKSITGCGGGGGVEVGLGGGGSGGQGSDKGSRMGQEGGGVRDVGRRGQRGWGMEAWGASGGPEGPSRWPKAISIELGACKALYLLVNYIHYWVQCNIPHCITMDYTALY